MNIIERIVNRWRRKEPPPERTDWLGVEVPEETVRRYFTQHTEDELDVPLAVARQVREETVALMARHPDAGDRQVAVWQGVVVGMARFAAVYAAGVAAQRARIAAGGKRP